jgi:hypothetical protein
MNRKISWNICRAIVIFCPPARSAEKSWLRFRPPPVDFCGF